MSNASVLAAVLAAGVIGVLLLPDPIALQSEALYRLREELRGWLLQPFVWVLRGPILAFVAWLFRRCCCGRFSSRCRAPHSLKAQALGSTVLVLWFTCRPPPDNPFHQEQFLVSWRRAPPDPPAPGTAAGAADSGTEADEDEEPWEEELLEECDFEDLDAPPQSSQSSDSCVGQRRSALLEGLPARAAVRLRVCAVNRLGRSEWSKEEIEVTLPGVRITRQMMDKGIGRSHVVTSSSRRCLQCRTPLEDHDVAYFAGVVLRPVVGGRDCPHGPFCERCRKSIGEQVLPSCVCRALIDEFHEAPAKPVAKPTDH